MRSQSSTDENLLPLTPEQLAAFQDIFKLLSSSPAGTVDMRSMKATLSQVNIQLSPQEMCEALRQADLDGDGTVNFKDFLGVLTDNHRFAQCLGRVRNSRLFDPQGLQTLLFEILLKLLSQGAVPSKSVQEVMSYYSKKQRGLKLNPSYRGQPRSRPPHVRTGIFFYCQAARITGLSTAQLARSLHKLHKAGARSPYSQMPNLTLRTRSERKTRNKAPRPEFPLPQPYQPSRPKGRVILGPISLRFSEQPLECWRSLKLPPSPPTLVQKQPFSPPPASLQRPTVSPSRTPPPPAKSIGNSGYSERSEVTCRGGHGGRRRALRRPVSERMYGWFRRSSN
ncbi:PREDICTED: EF-hand calcium-binding domain-containing protein 3-like [Chrysochloris asiatica]|uniref:EF-hand calcium-binding domain-containing protein 3-like n=1 Tax=Chrysochloris asiatica TaxID=185453 RepID=A0A9B0WI21_CHRAS|nr:PREDICTED: EF-hand calcium-binding domain-containing protein 3-like [Chrysochloris asiatica]